MRAKKDIRKTLRITAFSLGVIILIAVLLNSCKKEEPIKPNSFGDQYTTKSAFDCETNCIEIGGPYYEKTDQRVINFGPNTKTVDIVYYNTETDFVVKIRSTTGWNNLEADGVDVWPGGPVAANTWGVYSFPLAIDWEACDVENFELKVLGGGGSPAIFDVSYSLIGICENCETEFLGQAISCDNTREAIYRFVSEEDQDYIKIQGGLTNFTGEDAIVTVTGGNLIVTQSTPGGSSNRTIKVEGSVGACEEIIVHITWNSTNSGGIITGDWSVKDENSLELAPGVAGLDCD